MDDLILNARSLPYVACFILTLLLIIISNRLILSPLRSYPGPFLARLTSSYAGWHAVKGDLHLVTYFDHLKYGKIKAAPDRLVFNTLTALHDIYLNPQIVKAQIYIHGRFRNPPSIFTELDRNEHRRRRRVVGRAISERSMREFEPTMTSQVDVFLAQILKSSQKGQPVDMTPCCKYLATDIMGLIAFGCSWKTQTEETMRHIIKGYGDLNAQAYLLMSWPKTSMIDPGVTWLARKRVQRVRNTMASMISDRMALPRDARHDLYSFVESNEGIEKAQKEGVRKSDIWSEASLFINAGGTTTATALSTIFFYLSRNPLAYSRLADEIRRVFSSGRAIRQGNQLTSCKYLRAVIDESMRICPPTPGVMWRELDPLSTQPLVVDGHPIPPGTMVGVGVYSLMHNAAYFPEPFAFRPERWLESGDDAPDVEEARAAMRRAFIPFMLGDRGCAGKAMAYLEMSLTVAKTMWYFDFEIPSGAVGEVGSGRRGAALGRDRPDEYQLHDSFMASHEGPVLLFRPRGDFWKELI
ncbi:cytochrome P450 [Xylariomycetidae sp. FL2044]|nr:cytochrome P450 [Xylariomycetidae sp. FL2044]